MNAPEHSPEIGREILAAGYRTNLHDQGQGFPLLLIHGSGPGVTAWANWRGIIPQLARTRRVIAPDMLGFGYSERPADSKYGQARWVEHAIGVLDALGIERADIVGNSFGGGLALALAIRHPQRVRRLVLMGSVGVSFPLTAGLEAAWGYTPSLANMRALLDLFAHDRNLVNDELAELRYQASIRPGFQESFAAMFPPPRQNGIEDLASSETDIRALPHEALVIHGREDRIIPLAASLRLAELIPNSQLHVFGRCGHWTQIEHAERFARLVEDFLAEADRAHS
ncbi:2-hydroxy-6-oxo-2,4-heptadienoate hydrolase [Stutzerimonas stutzeri]|uniref:2-hydroxy-6-oxo-2,4-heptadienoate hydrolase n=1 Tax=Stutzerimonas stutzeri TaxID=316 RepID=A0A2N8TA12_STUST|nr:alpha/beta hydrolase [Stutzerimonas stutzeri]MCQ4326701.1 alpha/beta fold hydrolase [Stutzerimonas stutzeri]PNG11536.1 2-hydroxy-6-oxo-2,4-heptadienoate hydrolase [Stutzerimonas stutzeri]